MNPMRLRRTTWIAAVVVGGATACGQPGPTGPTTAAITVRAPASLPARVCMRCGGIPGELEAVADPGTDVASALEELLDASLVQHHLDESGEPRFDMLQTIRAHEFAEELDKLFLQLDTGSDFALGLLRTETERLTSPVRQLGDERPVIRPCAR